MYVRQASMFDFETKKKLRRFLYSPAVVGVFAALALYALYSTWSVYQKYDQSGKDLTVAQNKLLVLDHEESQVEEHINSLATPEGVENEIRAKYGMAKPGESVAVIDNTEASGTQATSTSGAWSWFKDIFGI